MAEEKFKCTSLKYPDYKDLNVKICDAGIVVQFKTNRSFTTSVVQIVDNGITIDATKVKFEGIPSSTWSDHEVEITGFPAAALMGATAPPPKIVIHD